MKKKVDILTPDVYVHIMQMVEDCGDDVDLLRSRLELNYRVELRILNIDKIGLVHEIFDVYMVQVTLPIKDSDYALCCCFLEELMDGAGIYKILHWIENEMTGYCYDVSEQKFYEPSWEPDYDEDRGYLHSLMVAETEKFKNCFIDTKVIKL